MTKRDKLVHQRLSVHGALRAQYVCSGMTDEQASKAAFNVVRSMTPVALTRYLETGK